MKFLMFTLASPLICFGETARWDHRGTEDMPTKSAVIGLLGCCLGLPRGDAGLCRLDEKLHMAAWREQSGPLLTDFQTVQSPTGAILNAMRKPRGSTIITPKQYLQDAVFHVLLYGDDDLLTECEAAMRRPKWVVSLGRRGCPPSVPIVPHVFEAATVREALEKHAVPSPDREGKPPRKAQDPMRCEVEYVEGMDIRDYPGAYRTVRHDAVIRADENQYGDRQVLSLPLERSVFACT